MDLFDFQHQASESKLDDTQIKQILLYLDDADAAEFKRLCKIGIKKLFPTDYIENGNISTFLLKLLKIHYGNAENK